MAPAALRPAHLCLPHRTRRRRVRLSHGGPLAIDDDSTICEVCGRSKQGAAFGYPKVRGYHPQLATCAQTGQVLFHRLRGGADSAFYGQAVPLTARTFDVRFFVTVRQNRWI